MDLYDIAIAKKLSGSGGGGGSSSDFTTATVTFVGDDGLEGFYTPYIACIESNYLYVDYNYQEENSKSYTVPLYKGTAKIVIVDTVTSTSGAVSLNDRIATITGDCSITLRTDY